MPEEKTMPFSLSGTFDANPDLYDYLHSLSFSPSGVVEMHDGAGQHYNARVKGRFSVQMRGQNSALVHCSDLVELKLKPMFLVQESRQDPTSSQPTDYSNIVFLENPDYKNEEPIRALAPISVLVTREQGIFPLMRQVIWKIPDKQQ